MPRWALAGGELESLDREQRTAERRIKAAKFPVLKSLETFVFRSIPSLNKSLVLELARSEYLDRRENVLALGDSGTGETRLALALGLAACQKGYRVRFTAAAALVCELLEARDEKRLLRFQKQLAKQDPLIVDELGYVLVEDRLGTAVRDLRVRAADGRLAGSSHPSRPYFGDERRELPSPAEQARPEDSPGPARRLFRRTSATSGAAFTGVPQLRSSPRNSPFQERVLPLRQSSFTPPQWPNFPPPLTAG